MNIFYLDTNIKHCAEAHFDPHVIKMILESTQILCTVCVDNGIPSPYKPTHKKHPCTLWAGESLDNWEWLKKLIIALDDKYRHRFNHPYSHKSTIVAKSLSSPKIERIGSRRNTK